MSQTIKFRLGLCIFMLAIGIHATAQNVKALKVVYDISYPGKQVSQESLLFNKSITLIHGKKSLTKTVTPYNDIATCVSYDCANTILTSMQDLPLLIKTSSKDFLDKSNSTVTNTNEIQNILGYPCKKIKRVTPVNGTVLTSYYYFYDYKSSEYCVNSMQGIQNGVEGIMLKCEQDYSGGAIQVWTATSLSEEFVDSAVFIIPSNYLLMTMDEYAEKLKSDKGFLRQVSRSLRLKDKTEDGRKLLRREIWNSIALSLLESTTQISQQISEHIATPDNQAISTDFVPSGGGAGGKSCPEGEAIIKQKLPGCSRFTTITGGTHDYEYNMCIASVIREAFNKCQGKMSALEMQGMQELIKRHEDLANSMKR